MEKGTLILIVCVIFGLGLFMVSKLGCFIKESRKEIFDERSHRQFLKKVEMSSKGRQKNADMHVIPGTVMPETGQKQKFKLHIETPSVKDYILTVSIFIGCTLIGLIFQKLYFTDANIVTIYILGVLLTSILTDGYLCSLAGSFLSVVLFCFFLTEPRMSFQTYAVGYPVTFLIMLISSVLTGTLAAKLKEHARLSAQQAFCTQILFDTNRLLQQVKDRRDILCVTCKQLVRLLNCNIVAYIEENGELSGGSLFFHNDERGRQGELLTSEEQYVARWAYENGQNAGATTNHFSSARCLYFVIKSGDNVYGVIVFCVYANDLKVLYCNLYISHVTRHVFSFEYFTRIGASTIGTSMTMIFGAVSHRSSGLSMSLDSTLETFTFGDCSCIDVIAVCKDVSFNFLSYCVFCSIFKSEFFNESLCCHTSFVKVTFFRFVNQFFSDFAIAHLNCSVSIVFLCLNLSYNAWTSL